MVYRVFISTTVDDESQAYQTAIKQALWNLKDFPVAPMTMEDLAYSGSEGSKDLVRQTLDETDIFIGVYGSSYGEYKELPVADLIEYEYQYALERGINTMIFMPADYDKSDERLEAFKASIMQRQVVMKFMSIADLKAKVTLAVTTHRTHRRKRPLIPKPPSGLTPARQQENIQTSTSSSGDFEADVQRAFDLIQDDLEATIQRALSVQEARLLVELPKPPDPFAFKMEINPIFGEPNQNAQFQSDIFMITPFRDNFNSIYQNIIVPTVNDMNLTIKRGDEFNSVSGQIMNEVWAAINACRLVIVETTEINANVYYELGIAHTLGKPAILITQAKDIEDFPFDIRHLRFIVYEDTIAGGEALEDALRNSIIRIINDLEDGI